MDERPDDPICLVVDDSEFDRRMIARALRRSGLGYRVRAATDLTDFRRSFGNTEVRAVILDNSLPDGRGIDLCVAEAKDPWFRRLAKLIVTDLPSPFMWEKAKVAGVSEVMLKSEVNAGSIADALSRQNGARTRR